MGNTTSCTPYVASGGRAKVIDCRGGAHKYVGPSISAAELMLDCPGLFVCDSSRLKVGSRVPGLAADEELDRRGLYFLLPMDMLYSVLTEEEMLSLSSKAAANTTKSKNIGRIFPALMSDSCLFPADAKQPARHARRPAARQRSWTPALDTIEEVPCT